MLLHLGLDIGSTTAKLAVLNERKAIIHKDYKRHYSDIKSTTQAMLEDVMQRYPQAVYTISIAGSAGLSMAKVMEIPFIQEVIACTETIETVIPETDVVIELGGEDAKLIYFSGGIEQRMNAACAGGTGAFIDQIATLLESDAEGLNELAKDYKTIYPIASRCGVFAKTDIQPLLNEGARKEDIAASVFQSVVTQTIAGLACGRPIRGKVAFLGGPLTYLSELRARFVETLKLTPDEVIFPPDSLYFVAIGAAINGAKQAAFTVQELKGRMDKFLLSQAGKDIKALPRLFEDEKELQAFRERHARASVVRGSLEGYHGPAFLGIDAGSTTTKIVLSGQDDELLFTFYESNRGNPVQSVIQGMEQLYTQMPEDVYIAHSAVTGYGEGLIKAALKVDMGEIETVAHYKAASRFLPEVDFILDIGGQDMKCIKLRGGVIDHLMLNEACSAGCGSFLESFASSANIPIEEFAKMALYAEQPADLGSRCTVFMNSKVKQVQKEGVSIADLSAGLSYSVVKNAIQKVMKLRNTDELGRNIVVQGGTFYNEAVLRAFELLIGREVIRPDIAGMMGAYGCALLAKEMHVEGRSSILPLEMLHGFKWDVSHSTCKLCGNSCSLTINRFKDRSFFITGNRCERGAGQRKEKNTLPNLFDYKYERIFGYESLEPEAAPRGTVGIPRVLNMYENYPFWFTFFTKLKYRVVLSPQSSKKLFEQGMESIPSESVCYPAKLAHGHITNLIQKQVGFIFYPSVVYERKEMEEANNHFNCPVVASYPEVIRVNMDELKQENVPFLQPFLTLDNKKALKKELSRQFPQISPRELGAAVEAAYLELERVKQDIRSKGEETIAFLKETGTRGIVLSGRPYHIDPEIHHGMSDLITGYGLAVLTEDSIAHLAHPEKDMRVVNQWAYHSRLYRAAHVVAATEELELVQLNSFGCGLDAVTADMVQEILEQHKKMFTLIKIDEINNLGAARIRIRSLQAAMKERERKAVRASKLPEMPRPVMFSKEMKKDYTVLIPQMSPVHFEMYETVLQSEGFRAELLPEVLPEAVDTGLRYVNNDACYPAILTTGQLVNAIKSGKYDPDRTAVIMSQTGGACRATNYIALLRKALKEAGLEQVPVISMNALGMEDHPGFKFTLPMIKKLVAATVYGDALMKVTNRIRPYEIAPGSTDQLYRKWMAIIKESLRDFRFKDYRDHLTRMVEEFDSVPILPVVKPKVGIVGEILVKFHPGANNKLADFIVQEGAEAVLPDMLDFFLYCCMGPVYKGTHLGKNKMNIPVGHSAIYLIEQFRKPMKKALLRSERFMAPQTIYELAEKAQQLVSVGNAAGEGWLLTAEMMELIEGGVHNIACIQPFGCIANHVTGRGMIKGLKQLYPEANITAIDYDASETEVNQVNRIKLMLAAAFKNTEAKEALPV